MEENIENILSHNSLLFAKERPIIGKWNMMNIYKADWLKPGLAFSLAAAMRYRLPLTTWSETRDENH